MRENYPLPASEMPPLRFQCTLGTGFIVSRSTFSSIIFNNCKWHVYKSSHLESLPYLFSPSVCDQPWEASNLWLRRVNACQRSVTAWLESEQARERELINTQQIGQCYLCGEEKTVSSKPLPSLSYFPACSTAGIIFGDCF
jgi:hypothetical protein